VCVQQWHPLHIHTHMHTRALVFVCVCARRGFARSCVCVYVGNCVCSNVCMCVSVCVFPVITRLCV
jgi:hypothetical protein